MEVWFYIFLGILAYMYGIHNLLLWLIIYTFFEVFEVILLRRDAQSVIISTVAAVGGWSVAAFFGMAKPTSPLILVVALLFAVCVWAQTSARFAPKVRPELLNARSFPKFQNVLPRMPHIQLQADQTLTLRMKRGQVWMGLRSPTGKKMKTTIWGFEYKGRVHSPGPTLVAQHGTHTFVRWENRLPRGPHLLPVDRTVPVAKGYDPETGSLPLVIHLHGGHTEWESDGHPEAWITQNFKKRGKFFRKKTYDYDNSEDATLLWYHDHVMGMTRLNNYTGLVGLYIIEDETEARLHRLGLLPPRSATLELAITDKLFTTDGSVYYPGVHGEPVSIIEIEPQWPNPTQLHEFWGQFVTVNGMVWPRVDVEPKAYRLRLLNASDTRTYVFTFANGMRFWKVGGDGGFLDAAVEITHLVLAPAQRADVVVDFSAYAGDQIVLNNQGGDAVFKGFVPPDDPPDRARMTPGPGYVLSDGQGGTTNRTDSATTGVIMRFDVKSTSSGGVAGLALAGTPLLAVPMPRWSPAEAARTRQLALFKGTDQYGRNALLLGTLAEGSLTFDDPVTEVVTLDTFEIWEIYNATVSGHPIHLHLVEFQVLNRQPFEATLRPKQHKQRNIQGGTLTDVRLIGEPVAPVPENSGRKDTVVVLPGQVTRIIAYFDRPGHYVWHCHLLSHEDWDMMRKLRIVSS